MPVRRGALVVLACLTASAAAAVAVAAVPAGPSLPLIAPAPKDLGGGARVVRQRSVRSPGYQAAFERELEFRDGVVGSSVLFFLTATVELARTPETTKADFASVKAALATPAGRVAVVKVMQEELRSSLGTSLKAAAMGTVRSPKIGSGALVVPISVTTTGGRLQVVVAYVRIDRVLVTMSVVGSPVARADLDRILALTADRAKRQLLPVSVSPPSVGGTVQVGQQVIASSGGWSNAPTSYAYRWSRCDSTGAACVTIPGATLASYTVTAADVGSTLRVAVIAKNGAGSTTAVSPQTALVTPPLG